MAILNMASLKFMHRGPFEAANELEETLVRSYVSLHSQLTPPYHLSTLTGAQHAHLTQALLCGILLSPSAAPSHVTHLTAVTTDGYASFVSILLRLVNESYPKLMEQTRAQILWLLKQLISLTAADVDTLCLSLLRQVAGGDLTPGNVWLAAQLLEVMKSSWVWVSGSPVVLTTVLYTYLRLLPDHAMGKTAVLTELKEKETAFCVQILRERFQDCLDIGRDLVRLLQDVTFIPEFEAIWRDLLNNPTSFKAPAFADIANLYVVRTPSRYLASRITPDMESQIRFMLTHVNMGSQRRYQTWFAQRFLSSPESETLVCDLIRFICCVHHPTNQILQSNIVPRWAIVGWLLKCCKSNHVEANAKLALFYDWLFFMRSDNIMNIEPAILLMVYSIPKYVDMTHSLLEFLFLLIEHYDPVRKDLIQKGVTSSIDILVGKGVVRSLEPLSASNLVASWLREKLVFYFSAYCKSEAVDGLKQVKSELSHQENSYDNVHQQMSGSMAKVGQGHREQGSGVDSVAGQDQNSDVEDAKSVDLEPMSRKRRRLGATETHLAEIQANFERLAEALTGSQEVGIAALEKLLWSFLSAAEHIFGGEKLSKETRVGDQPGALMSPSVLSTLVNADSSPLSVSKIATQITDVLKRSGYELFGPLQKQPSDRPEGDETMSLTSAVLRLYVANCRNHPILLHLLLSWHKEGLAVGARLLCYVSRLTEEIEPTSTRSLRSRGLSSSATPDSDALVGVLTKLEEDSCTTRMNGDGEEMAELAESSGEGIREQRKNGLTGLGAAKLHGSPNPSPLTRKASRSRDLNAAGDMHTRLRTAVVDAFKSYEEYLNLVKRVPLGSQQLDSNNSSQGNSNTTEVLAKPEAADLDGDSVEAELVSDLETCLLWNTNRFLRVLPSVFRYLPSLSTGREDILQLLVSSLDPQELCNFEFRLLLGEFAILGDHVEGLPRLIKNSLKWEFMEQQIFWRLLVAELQAASPAVLMQVLKICSTVLSPQVNSEALSGLLLLLRHQMPTSQLVNAVLSLPPAFGRLAAVVLASWASTHHSQLLSCLQNLNSGSPKERQKKGGEDGEDITNNGARRISSSAISVLLTSLDDTELVRNNEEERNARIVRAAEIKRALLKLTGGYSIVGMGSLQGPSETTMEYHDRKLTT
ncbi:unnamed protein product [Calypogeia fissa]